MRGPRSLLPVEHGAYGELAFPLATALLFGRIGIAAIALVVAIVASFVAHESALLLLGHRGARAKEETSARATRFLALLGSIAIASLLVAVVFAKIRWPLLVPLPLLATVGALVFARRERTLLGESMAAAALASAAFPVAMACGASASAALLTCALWAYVFILSTFAVRGVIGAAKQGAIGPATIASIAALVIASIAGLLAPALLLALLPVSTFAIVVRLRPPSPRRLREVGWSLIGACALTFAIVAKTLPCVR